MFNRSCLVPAKVVPISTKLAPCSTNSDRFRPHRGRFRPNVGLVRPNLMVQICGLRPLLGFFQPTLAKFEQIWPNSTNSGPCSTKFTTCGPISTRFAQCLADRALIWSCFGYIGLVSTNVVVSSARFWFVSTTFWPLSTTGGVRGAPAGGGRARGSKRPARAGSLRSGAGSCISWKGCVRVPSPASCPIHEPHGGLSFPHAA